MEKSANFVREVNRGEEACRDCGENSLASCVESYGGMDTGTVFNFVSMFTSFFLSLPSAYGIVLVSAIP